MLSFAGIDGPGRADSVTRWLSENAAAVLRASRGTIAAARECLRMITVFIS